MIFYSQLPLVLRHFYYSAIFRKCGGVRDIPVPVKNNSINNLDIFCVIFCWVGRRSWPNRDCCTLWAMRCSWRCSWSGVSVSTSLWWRYDRSLRLAPEVSCAFTLGMAAAATGVAAMRSSQTYRRFSNTFGEDYLQACWGIRYNFVDVVETAHDARNFADKRGLI